MALSPQLRQLNVALLSVCPAVDLRQSGVSGGQEKESSVIWDLLSLSASSRETAMSGGHAKSGSDVCNCHWKGSLSLSQTQDDGPSLLFSLSLSLSLSLSHTHTHTHTRIHARACTFSLEIGKHLYDRFTTPVHSPREVTYILPISLECRQKWRQ